MVIEIRGVSVYCDAKGVKVENSVFKILYNNDIGLVDQ